VEAPKVDLWKYLARSFLLPLGGVAATVYLIGSGVRGDDLKVALVAIALFVGVFNASELLKTWIESVKPKGTA
jgi:hypothetical protein